MYLARSSEIGITWTVVDLLQYCQAVDDLNSRLCQLNELISGGEKEVRNDKLGNDRAVWLFAKLDEWKKERDELHCIKLEMWTTINQAYKAMIDM